MTLKKLEKIWKDGYGIELNHNDLGKLLSEVKLLREGLSKACFLIELLDPNNLILEELYKLLEAKDDTIRRNPERDKGNL